MPGHVRLVRGRRDRGQDVDVGAEAVMEIASVSSVRYNGHMTTHTARIRQLLSEPRLANLQRQSEIFADLSLCQAVAQHPRNGLRPCLAALDEAENCANAHRHVEAA